jgi:hypothetical protein
MPYQAERAGGNDLCVRPSLGRSHEMAAHGAHSPACQQTGAGDYGHATEPEQVPRPGSGGRGSNLGGGHDQADDYETGEAGVVDEPEWAAQPF